MRHIPPGVERFIKRHGQTILTYVSATGVVGTAVMTSKCTTKANKLLSQAKQEKGDDLTTSEAIKVALPSYVPAIAIGAVTIGCIIGTNILSKKQNAALTSAYAILDRSYKEYRKKVEEVYGEGTDEALQEMIAKEHIKGDDTEEILFYDKCSKRFFTSTMYKVQRAEYELNRNLMINDQAYLNDWYNELGLDTVENDNKFGWSVGICMDMYWQIWIDFEHVDMINQNGEKYISIFIRTEPIEDFEEYFEF